MTKLDLEDPAKARLAEEVRESCDAALRLIKIKDALTICLLSYFRETNLPLEIFNAIGDLDLVEESAMIGQMLMTDHPELLTEYKISDYHNPDPLRIWPSFVEVALYIRQGLHFDGSTPDSRKLNDSPKQAKPFHILKSPTQGQTYPALENRLEIANDIVDTLGPLVDAQGAVMEAALDLNYDGLSLQPFATTVELAKKKGQDLSRPLSEWFPKYWPEALKREDTLDYIADNNLAQGPRPIFN